MSKRFECKKKSAVREKGGYLRSAGRVLAGLAAFLLFLAGGIGLSGYYGTSFGHVGRAYANAPVPRYEFEITIKNAPEGALGIDFLVPKDSIPEEEYLELNEEALSKQNIPLDCELAAYELDGAVSYSAHDVNGAFDLYTADGKKTKNLDHFLTFSWPNSEKRRGYFFMMSPAMFWLYQICSKLTPADRKASRVRSVMTLLPAKLSLTVWQGV